MNKVNTLLNQQASGLYVYHYGLPMATHIGYDQTGFAAV
jgi:hypothetical protein